MSEKYFLDLTDKLEKYQRHITEWAMSAYSLLGKAFEQQTKIRLVLYSPFLTKIMK